MLSHDVFFTLHDQSAEAVERLVAACHERLRDHPGVVFFSAGGRSDGLDRDVNDLGFDAALHVVFEDRNAHDAYQDVPEHHLFIADNESNWASVRVFDSDVTGGAGRVE